MKSFIKFLIEARGGPDFSDEKSHELLWNYLLKTSDSDDEDGKKVRDAVKNKEWDTVETELDNLINKIKTDTNHPLHFDNLEYGDGFTGNPAGTAKADKGQKTAAHKTPYEERIDRGKSGILSMLQSRQGNSMGSKGWPVSAQGGEHQTSKSDWGGNPKGQGRTDLVYTDPDNPKAVHRQSQKDVRGSQAYSAGGDQFASTVKAGAKEITKVKFDKPKKEKGKSDAEHKQRLTKIKLDKRKEGEEKRQKIGRQAERTGKLVDAMRGKSREEKQRLKGLATRMTGRMERQNPGLSKAVGQEALTGKAQFGNKVDTVITTGDERSKVKDPRGTSVGAPRPALPKDETRGGNVKGDIKPEQTQQQSQANQSSQKPFITFQQFKQKNPSIQGRHSIQAYRNHLIRNRINS